MPGKRSVYYDVNGKSSLSEGHAGGHELRYDQGRGKADRCNGGALSEITESVSELEETCDTLHSYAEELDEDLGAVEDMLYDEDEGCGDDCCCHGEDDEISDDDFIEVDCPKCGETVCFDDTIDPTSILAPTVAKSLAVSVTVAMKTMPTSRRMCKPAVKSL